MFLKFVSSNIYIIIFFLLYIHTHTQVYLKKIEYSEKVFM